MTSSTGSTLSAARLRLAALAAGLLVAAAPALAVEPFSADYKANYMGMEATATMSLAPEGGDRWKYSLDLSGMGAEMKQSTVFEAQGDAWRPLSSTDSQRGTSGLAAMLVKKKSVTANYDWAGGVARWTGDVEADKAGPVKLQKGDLDGMLMNLALVRDVAAGKPLQYRLVEDGRAREQTFQVAGTETVQVGGKSHEATKVVRKDGKRELIAWVVKGIPVPARVLQRRNGQDHIDLKLATVR